VKRAKLLTLHRLGEAAMLRTFLLPSALFIGLAATLGCVGTNHMGHRESLRCVGVSPFPAPIRQQVYLFIMNGDDLLELSGLMKLRDDLTEAGFPKIYYAQKEDRNWYRREMARLHRDEPDARFVMLSYGSAAERTLALATVALQEQQPLDGVVFLEPYGIEGNLRDSLPTTTVTVRSHRRRSTLGLVTTEEHELQGSGLNRLARHPQVLPIVLEQLSRSASRVRLEDIRLTLPALPLHESSEQPPRPVDPKTVVSEPGYEFLPAMPRSITPPKPKKPAEPDDEKPAKKSP